MQPLSIPSQKYEARTEEGYIRIVPCQWFRQFKKTKKALARKGGFPFLFLETHSTISNLYSGLISMANVEIAYGCRQDSVGVHLLVFEKVTFFRLSSYFVFSDGLDNPNTFV